LHVLFLIAGWLAMNVCDICGSPWDAGFFDESNVFDLPRDATLKVGQELVLARYELHRNYCGVLMSFAQLTELYARDNAQVCTPGYVWQVRCNGQPRDPYLELDHILNPWGQSGLPVHLRLEEGCVVELVIRNLGVSTDDPRRLSLVGGRITGRYWYNTIYGGAPNQL
jgi:hypothetical protein